MNHYKGRRHWSKAVIALILIAALAVLFLMSCSDEGEEADAGETTAPAEVSDDAAAIAEARGLTPDDITAALKTYTPSGVHDEYVMFASGGHSGQV
jgi:nitrous-oxide reductase